MTKQVDAIVEPFVRRGLFDSPENAVTVMAREYVLGQIERYRRLIDNLEAKYGMSYEQFEAYLQSRATSLLESNDSRLQHALMHEEEDAFDWKVAHQMLQSWLGLQSEVRV